jgi:hypothetical protein
MTTILCIGVVIALATIALVARTLLSKPVKAKKSEKAAIMKQLLALSETESKMPSVALRPLRTTSTIKRKRVAKLVPPPVSRTSPQVHSSPGRC